MKFFRAFQNPRRDTARTISPDPHPHASPRTLSRVLPLMARHGVNCLSCQCEACLSRLNGVVHATQLLVLYTAYADKQAQDHLRPVYRDATQLNSTSL